MTLAETRLAMWRNGYSPLPLHGKNPDINGKGWQLKRQQTSEQEILLWDQVWPYYRNTGCLTYNTPVLDADILDRAACRAVFDRINERFEDRALVLCRVGLAPKFAVPFRTSTPFRKFDAKLIAPDGREMQFEFLGEGNQFVSDGIHPDTRQPYRWWPKGRDLTASIARTAGRYSRSSKKAPPHRWLCLHLSQCPIATPGQPNISPQMDNSQSTEQNFVWKAQPGPQSALIACTAFEVFYGGARGGGKTDGVLGEWIVHAHLYGENAIGLVIRRGLVELREMIERSKVLYLPLGAVWHVQDKAWRFPNGARLTFAHLENDDAAQQYQGHSYTRVYVEEIGNFPSPDPILKLMATLRSGAGVPVGFRATGNPGGPGHQWVKARYIDPAPGGYEFLDIPFKNPFTGEAIYRDRVFIPAKVTDNKFNNTADYLAQLQMSGGERLVKAWLFGDWDIVVGAFFDNWNSSRHVIKPFALPRTWLRFMAGDWGSAKPFCFGWYAVVTDAHPVLRLDGTPALLPRGALIKYREYYGSKDHNNVGLKLTVEQAADQILNLESSEPVEPGSDRSGIKYRVLDPACFADEGGPTIGERFGNKGLLFHPAKHNRTARGSTAGGWNMLRDRLDGEEGRPMLYFFDTCIDSIRTIPALQHDPNKLEDIDTEAEDHADDETRYAVMSRPWVKRDHTQFEPAMTPANEFGTVMLDLDKLFKDNERAARRRAVFRAPRI